MQLIPPLAQGYYKIQWSSPRRQAAFPRLHLFSKQIAKDILLEAKPQLRIVCNTLPKQKDKDYMQLWHGTLVLHT